MNRNDQRARTLRWMWRRIMYLGLVTSLVTLCGGFVLATRNETPKDAWDKVDIVFKAVAGIAGVLVPAVIAWGIHVYSKRQHQAETMLQTSEFRLRQLDVAREFLPQFLSQDTDAKWAALRLIRILGDEGHGPQDCQVAHVGVLARARPAFNRTPQERRRS